MDDAQLLKGVLEGCILSIISRGETYGYHILSELDVHGFSDIKDGTLYPLLTRLEKKSYIICRIGESTLGPKRKYYSISLEGLEYLEQFKASYLKIMEQVKGLI